MTALLNAPKIETTLHTYRFNIYKLEEAKAYHKLCKQLRADKNRGRWMNCISMPKTREQRDNPIKPGPVTLETSHIFDNQWNSETHRVFDWYEEIYPNKDIKEGHYLEMTDEMIAIRNDTCKCGYCGAMYWTENVADYCESCIGNEYLKPKDLPLLLFKADKVTEEMREHYDRANKTTMHRKAREKTERTIKKAKQDIEDAEHELEVLQWLIGNGLGQHINNVIYYSHRAIWCFGWRKPISDEEYQEILGAGFLWKKEKAAKE